MTRSKFPNWTRFSRSCFGKFPQVPTRRALRLPNNASSVSQLIEKKPRFAPNGRPMLNLSCDAFFRRRRKLCRTQAQCKRFMQRITFGNEVFGLFPEFLSRFLEFL